MDRKFKGILETMEFKPDLDLLLNDVESDLVNMKERGEVSEEKLGQFRIARERIDAMGSDQEKEKEKEILLRLNRNLIKAVKAKRSEKN